MELCKLCNNNTNLVKSHIISEFCYKPLYDNLHRFPGCSDAQNGKIEIYNRAAKRYLSVQQPRHLSSLKTMNNEMFKIINVIKPGQEILHKMIINNHLQSILVKAIELKFENGTIKLVSFQDITNELDKKELDSWQRLIRVLTHEIMNSISPITSLTGVISGYFKKINTQA